MMFHFERDPAPGHREVQTLDRRPILRLLISQSARTPPPEGAPSGRFAHAALRMWGSWYCGTSLPSDRETSHAILFLLACSPVLACNPAPVPEPEPVEVIADAGPDVEVEVGAELVLDARASSGGDVRWDTGDGTTLEGAVVRHTWSAPGNYVAVVSVTGEGGLRRTDSARVTVYLPAADPPPVSSSAMALDVARGEVWIAEPDADLVTIVPLAQHDLSHIVFLPVCDRPRSVAIDGATAAVTCEGSGEVLLIDTLTRAVTRTWPFGPGGWPFGVVGRGGRWWVTGQGRGELIELAGTDAFRTAIGDDPRALALDPQGRWYATRFRPREWQGELYSAGGTIGLAPDPGPDSDTQNRGVPAGLHAIAISPDGGTAWVGGHVANNEAGLFLDGEPLTIATTVRATVRVIDLATGAERLDERKVLDNAGEVSAFALSPRGNWLWVAEPGTGTLLRLDAYTLDNAGTLLGVGAGIDALQITPDGATLLVHASLDRELQAWDISDPLRPTLAWSAPTVDIEPLAPSVLRGKRLFHDAADTRLARDGYLSCAVCHPDGRDDGVVWDFTQRGEGLRNTISLLGRGGTGMGRVHWTGNFDEIQDFEGDIRNGQGGAGLLHADDWSTTADPLGAPKAGLSDDLDALADYVASLDAPAPSPWTVGGEGEALFFSKGCDTCHIPALGYTDSSLAEPVRHDVGTVSEGSGGRLGGLLDGFDTPTLLGVWQTAPYLHDGSAPSLAAAIGAHNLPDLQLTPQEKVLLATFVMTL